MNAGRIVRLRAFAALAVLCAVSPEAVTGGAEQPETAISAVEHHYREARSRWRTETNSAEAAWSFARACFDRAEFATNDTQRAALAEEGIAASKRAVALAPDAAAARLYLGMNLGQLARTKLFSALGLLDEMEAAWKKAIELDPRFDYAGAHRSLGLLYLDAPGWPVSLGSRAKARQHLKKAVELCPDYPGNQLCWLEALLKWDEIKTVRAQTNAVEDILKAARGKLAGAQWQRDWQEWDDRWRKIKAKAAVAPVRSPRGKE